MARLSEPEIDERLSTTEWRREGDAIARDWKFEDFAGALAFVNRVGAAAEETNHHPDILLHSWNQVRLTLSTHSEGGLTAADFEMAERLDRLA